MFCFPYILENMEEKVMPLTVLTFSQRLGISTAAVNKRLQRTDKKPYMYIGSSGIYTEADFEAIKDGGKRGRPYPDSKQITAPKTNPKKTAKKT
jgi:hypothetical protein